MSNSLRPHGNQNAGLPCPSPTFQSLLKLMSIESLMPSNYLILYPALLLLPSIFPSIRVFFNESFLHIRWPKYWSIMFNISPSNEHSGLIFTTTIQHSFGSFGHSNQSRKRNKRNPDCKRRSKTLTVCR